MGIRSGEGSVAAGAAAVSAPSGPDCGGDRRWRGQGTATEGEGSEKAQRRGRSWSTNAGRGRWGEEELPGRRQEQRVCAGGAS